MKHIEIIKETEDLREGRSKILKKGTSFTCTDELAEKYLKKKLAKIYEPDIKPVDNLKTVEEVELYEDKKQNNDD